MSYSHPHSISYSKGYQCKNNSSVALDILVMLLLGPVPTELHYHHKAQGGYQQLLNKL